MKIKIGTTRSIIILIGLVITLLSFFIYKNKSATQDPKTLATMTVQKSNSAKSFAPSKKSGQTETKIVSDQYEQKNLAVRLQMIDQMNQLVLNFNKSEKQNLLEQSFKNPLAFAEVSNEFLEQLPFDQIEIRNELLGVVIDTADHLKQTEDLKWQSEEFFKLVSVMVDREMNSPEIVNTNQLDSLSNYQLRTLAHEGSVIEKNGNFLRSSLSTKVMALSLAAQNPNLSEKEEIVKQLKANSYGMMENGTNEILVLIAQNLFFKVER